MLIRGGTLLRLAAGRAAPIAVGLLACALMAAQVAAETLVFQAAQPGSQTLDEGQGGGNPFASALIEALSAPLDLGELPAKLRSLTAAKSNNFQVPDVPALIASRFSLVPALTGETRIALVLVVSDYSASGGAVSLPGAKHDAERMTAALQNAGFETEQALDLDLHGMRTRLEEFRDRSQRADAAVIYTTGHGLEVEGTVFLLPGDYPVAERNRGLARRALPMPEITRSLAARQVNIVFYGGCRDNPFAH